MLTYKFSNLKIDLYNGDPFPIIILFAPEIRKNYCVYAYNWNKRFVTSEVKIDRVGDYLDFYGNI